MRFLEVPALITEDIEDSNIVDITEPITASISGTTLTIDGDSKVSGETTITLTNDVTVSTVTTSNIRQPSIHKITIKTNGVGNFTYTPNAGVTASSVSTTTKTGSDLEILLITTSGGETYLDLDVADYVSPAANFSNVLSGFNVSDLTSEYGATAKLYKPGGTLLTTVNSAATGSGVNFGYTESLPGDVIYELEVTDDIGRKSKYNLTRKWINYAMETTSTPGFQKFALEGNEYTTSVMLPNLSSTSKARVHKTTDHGYMGINFKIQGRDDPSGAWTDIPDNPPTNVESDESAEFLVFGNYKYQRVWVKPTAQASTTVSSSNVVTLTLSNVTEDVTTKTITGTDPFHVDETSNIFVFEETAKIGTIPYTVTVGTETYTNTVTATTKEIRSTPNTDFTSSGANMKHYIAATPNANHMCQASGDGRYIVYHPSNDDSVMQVVKGDGENGYTNYATFTYSQASSAGKVGSVSYDGKYVLVGQSSSNSYGYEIWKNDESTSTFTKLSQTVNKLGDYNHTYKPSFVPRSGNYDFCITGTDNNNNFDIQLYKHNAGTDTWTAQTIINDPANRPSGDGHRGFFACQFTRDGKYLMMGAYSTYGGYQMYTIDWDANTAVFSGAHWQQNNNIGHSGTVTPDGKYVLIFHNDGGSRRVFKNNDAGDWSSATDVTTDFTFDTTSTDQGNDISFFGEHGEYFVSLKDGGYVRVYSWYANKEITLTYNGKDMLTLAHKGSLTTTSVKLYKDDVLYHTFGASETSVVIAEAGVYQAIADEKYYSLNVTVTTVTETQGELYLSHRTCFLLKKDGKVWYWGESGNGVNATGNNTTVNVATLNENLSALPSGIKQIGRAAVDAHCRCAITNDGKLYTWGYNGHGGLGRGNTSDYTNQGPWLVSSQSSNTFTFCHSSYYSNFALQDNGYLWSCGHNPQYVLGTGNNSDQSTFYRINLPNVIDFDCNHDIALALTSDSEVYIWGTEGNSSMGGASGTTGTPTHMTTLDGKNIVKVRTGGFQGYAISSDGKLYAWGRNDNYQIPKGTTGNVTTPTEMNWFSRKSIKVVDVALGHNDQGHLALDDQGNMYVWGKADNGVTGDYTETYTHSWPVLLKENIASISCGYAECGCIDKFGQVYTWGDAAQGQQNWIHGTNSDTDINIPTSNNLSVGSSVVYDGFDKYLLGKDSTVTSNVTFGSNTVSLGTKSEVFISDPHTYKFKIMESGKTTYTSTVISSTPTRPTGRVYPPKSGTHKNLAMSTTANVDNTWTIDGALYGNGDYKASMDKALNGDDYVYYGFNGDTGYSHLHTSSSNTVAIQLHMPQKIKLTKYAMYARNFTGEYTYAPKDWKVYGSNDNGTNWTELDSQTNETVTAWGSQLDHRDTKREYTVTGNTKYFSSYKLDVTAVGGGDVVIISQIEYYGDEEGFLSDDGFGKLTVDVKGDSSATSNIVFHSNTYAMGAARDLYITDTGEYTADIYGSNKHFLGSKTHTVSGVDAVPGFTVAFHHGAFSASDYSSAYSSVADAATAGFVYSDTPAGTYTWGTLAAQVKERENPDFTANSTLHTDYSSTYGWTDTVATFPAINDRKVDYSQSSSTKKCYEQFNADGSWNSSTTRGFSLSKVGNTTVLNVNDPSDNASGPYGFTKNGGSDITSSVIVDGDVIQFTTEANTNEGSAWTVNEEHHLFEYGGGGSWAVSADSEESSNRAAWKAFDKLNNTFWHSNHSSGVTSSTPATLTIQYLSSQVIKSYNITSRNDATDTNFPSVWKLQGYDGSSWVDIGSEQTVTTWTPGATKRFDVSSNTTAYTKYQLRITTTIRGASTPSTSDFAAIAAWKLYTLNNENNTVHDDHTEYTWTPVSTITANVLRVAGGGVGGNTRSGGGGAGGLLYSENVSLSGAKKIVVGNGGKGKIGNQQVGDKGHDTLFEGLTTVVGGGSAAGEIAGTEGGSSGGNSGRSTSAATAPYPSGQGNAGGTAGADNMQGAGGGGAGGVGANQSGSATGGVGLDYSSVFGTTYGESGWFAGGGGGATGGSGGQGGGGDGTNTGTPGPGQKHTGGGSGGKGNSDNTNKMQDGGSGIVLIKKLGATNPPALNFDGYNKLSIDNTYDKSRLTVPVVQVESGFNFSSVHADHVNKLGYPFPASGPWAHHHFVKVGTDGDKVLFDLLYVGTAGNPNSNTTVAFDTKTGIWSDPHPGNDPDSFSSTESGTYTSTLTITSNNSEVHFKRGDGTYLGFITLTGWDQTVTDNVYTIKKDGAAFATTTSNTVYIRDTGTYTAEVKGSGAYVTELSKDVTGDITEFPNYVNATSFYYGGGVVDNTGKLYTWGHNGFGDSGRGASDRAPTHVSSISDPVSNVWRGDPGYTMAAKTSTDKWYMWGRNTYSGVLGNTTNTGNVTTPEDVTAKVTTYFGDQTVSANKILKIVMGEHHAAALTAGGKVWSWGGDYARYSTGTGTNNNTVLVTPVQLNRSPPTSGTGYEITNTNSSTSTLKIRANGSIFTFNSQTCWYYDRLAGSNNTWYTQQLGYVPSTNTFIEASISGNPDQVYHNKTSSNVTKGSITVPPEGILLSNDPSSWNGAALFANPFTSSFDPNLTGITEIQTTFSGTAALDSSGNVWFWGGASTSMQYAYPTKLLDSSSISGIIGMATNGKSIYAWKSDGTFYTRGAGNYGQLANGADNDQYTSWQTVTTLQGKTIKKVFGGNENIFAWTDDGVYGVGRGNNHKLANGSTSNRNIWHKSNTLSALSIKEIDFGHATGLVLTTDGKGYMWGEDSENSMANALSGHQSGAAEATSISALSIVHIPSPSITYDGKNKLTLSGTNYEDTATVSDPNGSIHEIGTAKTMYVKDAGEYMFKINGTDKYADSNVYVSSVDLAGATTKPIDFDGYNKLTLIDAGANAVSNLTYFSNTYEMGSAKEFYIKDQGTYDLEMSGSNVFALSSNVVGALATELEWKATETQILYTDDHAAGDQVGHSVSVDGNYAVVGASQESTGGSAAGAAYIFYKSGTTWSQQAKLVASDAQADDHFGKFSDVSGDYVIVGAPDEDTGGSGKGAAYIFKRSGTSWTQTAKIQGSSTNEGDLFGYAVSIDGDYAIVGAYSYDSPGSGAGAAYIFKRDTSAETWSQQAELQASDATSGDSFGNEVCINGDYVAIGASGEDTGSTDTGAAYIFKRSGTTWSQQVKIQHSDNSASDSFGSGLSLDGDYCVVGAQNKDSGFGSAYIFKKDTGAETWTQEAKINASDRESGDAFGNRASISGNLVIVSSRTEDTSGSNAGAAYIFERSGTTWTEVKKITASNAGADDHFGTMAAIDGTTVFVGAPYNDTKGSNAGAAYIFEKGAKAVPSLTFDNSNKLTVSNFNSTDTLWPPSDGTWSISTDNSTTSEWTISGASYGNGSYKATSSVATNGSFRAYQAFEGTESGNTSTWQILATAGILSIELPESVLINKYALLNRNYNVSDDEDASPKDFTFEGSSDGSTWVVLDTVTGNGYYTAEGTASQQTFTTSNTTAYKHYRLNVTANNGDSGTVVGELKLLVSNPRTATLTDPNGSTYALGQTQDTIYIKDTGDYTLDVQNNDQKAIVTKNVTGTLSVSPGTPLMTSILVTRNNGSDYTEASPSTERNGAWESRFVVGNVGTVDMDGSSSSGVGFSMYLNFDQTFTVNTAVFKMMSTHSTYKDVSFRCGTSESDYITVDPGSQNFASTQTITFTFSTPITVNKLYFAVVQDDGNDLYNIRMTNGDIIINGLAYPLADSDKVLPSPVLNFDNFNKLTVANVDSDATSNIDFFSNTYEMGSRKELIINDAGTYHANIYSSNTLALVKKQVATVNSNPTGTYNTISNIDGTGDSLGRSHTGHPISFNAAGTRVVIGEELSYKAHIYDKVGSSWTLSQTWTTSDNHGFGNSCVMSDDGNVVVVVENDSSNNRMSLFVYENGSWVTKQDRTETSGARDTFGGGLFMSGDGEHLLVTDYSYEGSNSGKGRVHIFDISGYSFIERLNIDYSTWAEQNRGDIDRYGNRAIWEDNAADYFRVYKRSGTSWSQSTTIAPSNTSGRGSASCDENMVRVAISDIVNSSAGVTIWYRNPSGDTFALEQTITVDNSGCNISMNYAGDRLMITDKTAGDTEIWTRSGTTWTKQKTINPPTFGTLVNHSQTFNKGDGYTLAITDETYDSNKGRVYIYSDPPPGPSLTFDGYNKLTAPVIRIFTPPSVINFHSDGSAEDWAENGYAYHNITNTASGPQTFQLRTSSGSANGDGSQYNISIDFQKSKYVCADVGSSSPHFLMVGDGSAPSSIPTTTTVDLINPTDYLYIFQSNSNVNGYSILDIQGPDLVTTVITKTPDSYDIGTASSIYIDATGTYDAQAKNSNTFVIKTSKVVSGSITRNQIWNATETQILSGSDTEADDRFGSIVSIDGNYAVIGADNEDAGGSNAGAVYIFYKSGGTWAQQAKLVADNAGAGDKFGRSVSISGDYVVVSSPFEDTTASDSGSVYIFKRSGTTWSQQQQIQAGDAANSDFLGSGIGQGGGGIAIDNDYFIIGAVNNDDNGANSGSAYIFKKTTTTHTGTKNPYFTDASTIVSDSNWSSSTGFEITASSQHDGSSASYSQRWRAFDNTYTAANSWESTWLSDSSMPAWVQIQYPQDVVIKSYTIVGRDATNRYYPTSWQLQGATAAAPSTYVNLETTSGNRTASSWAPLAEVSHDVNTPNTAYRYFRLYVNSSNESNQVSINELKLFTTPLSGQSSTVDESWSQQSKLIASDAAASDQFGTAVTISGDYAIVGSPNEDTGGTNAGSAYIFKKGDIFTSYTVRITRNGDTSSTGTGNFDITPSDGNVTLRNWGNSPSSGNLGAALWDNASGTSLRVYDDGTIILAGETLTTYTVGGSPATFYECGSGLGGTNFHVAITIVSRTTGTGWSQQQKIQASDPQADDAFGGGVSLSGDYLAVGARQEDTGGTDAGSVYIFKKASGSETWSQEAKLQASDVSTPSRFGMSVSLSGNTLAVGANAEDTGGSNAGAAYIFERSGTTWTEVKKITASDAQADDYFGESISTDGTTTFVGAWGEDTKGSKAGAVYTYEKVYVGPTLTYDNANKLSLTGVTTPSSNLTVGTNTYDIGSAKDVYIKDQGTYKFHTNDGDQALIMNKTVSSDPSGGVPGDLDTVVAFHQGTFSDGGDPYSHGSVAAAATAGYVYSDTAAGTYTWGTLVSGTNTASTGTPQSLNFVAAYTTYSWTPPNALTGARTLVVAGGGGGGADDGGGGGAGGYLEASDQSMSGAQTIIVGGGGDGIRVDYNNNCYHGGNGGNSSISGTSQTSIGGGGGGSTHNNDGANHKHGQDGGSGGGSGGRNNANGGSGTPGQGYDGASNTSSSYHRPSGGGGASEAGTDGMNSSISPDGGDGKQSDILGTTYWWSGGGGGANHHAPKGGGGKGGGGSGAWGYGSSAVGGSSDTNGVSDAETTPGSDNNWHQRGSNAGKHTGGGGGGGSHHNAGGGGHGGSGMVVIKFSKGTKDAPTQVYDNTKTITVSNIPSGTSTVGKIYKGATAYTIHATEPTSNVIIKNTGSYVSVFTTSSAAYFTNTVNVNATPTTTSDDNTIEDEAEETTVEVSKTIAFHDGTFADSDDPHGDGSITAAATAGHVYSDTAPGTYTWGTLTSCVRTAMANNEHSTENWAYRNGTVDPPTAGFTTYKWTPPGAITNGRTLVVAGGGGGGTDMAGGGGAGGLLASTTTNIAHAEQTIQVGGPGSRGYSNQASNMLRGGNGADSSISGPSITAIGGGGGATKHNYTTRPAGNGGSGGGGSGGRASNGSHGGERGTGTPGQGHDGARSGNHWYPGGGGGAGEKGYGRDGSGGTNVRPDGGNGLEDDILGTSYWWAGGGGGNGHSGDGGHGGKGGGGGGSEPHYSYNRTVGSGDTNGITNGKDGEGGTAGWHTNSGGSAGKHTGGGGGGGDHHDNSNPELMRGGLGGSGIVAIKFTAQGDTVGIPGSTAVASASSSTTTDAPSTVLVATTEVAAPTLNLDFTANMSTFPRNLKRYNSITSSSIGARFNRTESKKKRVHKSINTDTFSIELTANNMGDSSSSTSTLPVTVVNSGAGTQYESGWTTAGSTSSFVVPSDAPNTLYYYCENHSGMGGSISVSSASTTTHTVTVVSSSAGTQYTSGWTASGTPGSSGGINTFIAPSNAPSTLYYYCGNHSGMGGAINMVSGPVSTTFAVTVQSVSGYYGSSSNYYFIDGTQQATISLVRGKTYTFNNNASANHPMYITTSSDGTTYTSGVTNGGTSSVTFAVPLNAPSTLYYKCGNHNGMGGTINILGPTASPLAVTVAGGKFVIGGVSQATLQLVRGETYVFNQENSSNGTHPLRLSTTSNGTHVSGGSGFYIGGTQRPTLSMVRGNTYTFDQTNASNGSHVLQIATASDGTQYTSGYTTGTFVVPLSAPSTLYYKSSTTAGMGGLINVTGSSTSAFIVTAGGGKFSIGGVEQASLSVIRGLTYTFNQISGHVLSLSSTSDGTRNTGVNKYYISGVETPTLTFIRGSTYTFTQATSTNTGHPIRLSTTSNGTHASGSQYTSGWTTTGTPGSSGASSQFIVPANAPNTLYYYCQHHSGMGGASSINVADSNSGILLTYGTHALVANSTVSGEYTIATNFDGTTSNLYVNNVLISQTTPTIASGAKMLKIGEDYNGLIKNLKFWNKNLVPVEGNIFESKIGSMSSGSWYDEGTTHMAPNIINSVAQTSGESWTDGSNVTHTIWGFDLKAGLTGTQAPHSDDNSWITFKPGTTTSNGTWHWGLPSNPAQSRSGTTISIYEGSTLRGQFTDTNMFVNGLIPTIPFPKAMKYNT